MAYLKTSINVSRPC